MKKNIQFLLLIALILQFTNCANYSTKQEMKLLKINSNHYKPNY